MILLIFTFPIINFVLQHLMLEATRTAKCQVWSMIRKEESVSCSQKSEALDVICHDFYNHNYRYISWVALISRQLKWPGKCLILHIWYVHTEPADAFKSEGMNFPLISCLWKVRPWIQSKALEHLCWSNLSAELLAVIETPCSSSARCSTSHLPHYWQNN